MKIVCRVLLSACSGDFSKLRRCTTILLLAVFSLGATGSVFAVDPPENIRLEDGIILWDPVEDAVNYNVYLLTGPVVDNTVTPRYVTTVEDVLEFRPTVNGFYTIVTVGVGDDGLEFSDVADGVTVALSGLEENPPAVTIGNVLEIRTVRCENVVAGGSCESQCSFSLSTGGACRADAGVVLHQRALSSGYECISQNDTSFVEADAYCLSTGNL